MADLESKEAFKFTEYLRSKQRGGARQSTSNTRQQEVKEIVRRNVMIKRSYELERKGLLLNPYLFEPEANLLRKCKYSQTSNYQHLYSEFLSKAIRRLDKPPQTADVYVLARIYRYLLLKTSKDTSLRIEDSFKNDYFTFVAMYQQRLDTQKQEEIESLVFQIHAHREAIKATPQNPDVLATNGYSYSDETFDDLFTKSFQEAFLDASL